MIIKIRRDSTTKLNDFSTIKGHMVIVKLKSYQTEYTKIVVFRIVAPWLN
jgi:hypothetical protein